MKLARICPNYNSDYWKGLVEQHGEKAHMIFFNENQGTFDEDVDYSSTNPFTNIAKKTTSKPESKRPSVSLGLFRNWFEYVPTTVKQRRLYNVEYCNVKGEGLGKFFPIDIQESVIEGLFKLTFDNIIKQQKDIRENNTGKDIDVDSAIDKAISSLGSMGLSLYKEKDLPIEEREKNKFFSFASNMETYIQVYDSRSQFKEFVKRKFDSLNVDIDNIKNSLLSDDIDEESLIQAELYKDSEERDPKETMSKRVKLFLATMPEFRKDEDGSFVPVRNIVGMQKLYGFENIYEKLVAKLSSRDKLTFADILKELESNPDTNPTFYMLAKKIKDIDKRIQNEFVTAFDKINAEQYVSNVRKDSDSDSGYRIFTIKSNRNSYIKKILSLWEEDQKRKAKLIRYSDIRGEYVIDNEKVNVIKNTIDFVNSNNNLLYGNSEGNWYKTLISAVKPKEVNDYLKSILPKSKKELNKLEAEELVYSKIARDILVGVGVNLSDEAFNDLISGEYEGSDEFEVYNNKTIKNQFGYYKNGKPSGVMSDILRILQGKSEFTKSDFTEDSNLQLNNPLYTSTKEVTFLAELQGKYSDIVTTTHLTAEGKKVYDFLLPNFQFKEFLRIKNNESYREEISKDLFAGNNYLFDALNNQKKRANYKLGLFEALDNKDSGKAISRDNMSDREQFMIDYYNFLNDGDESTANYFDLTKSDKKTTPFHVGVPKLNYFDAVKWYYKAFKAEYTRATSKETLKLNEIEVSKQFQIGMSKFFLLPEFNAEFLKDIVSDTDFNKIYTTSPEKDSYTLKTNLSDKVLRPIVENVIKNKIIPSRVDSVIEAFKREQVPVDIEADMANIEQYAYNTNLFNISIAMLYSGDVALFSKGNPDKIVDFLYSTYDVYTKRLAKDIAPGIKPNFEREYYSAITISATNTYSKEYKDLFLNKYYGLNENGKGQVDPSDAAQFCTVNRYFEILYALGRVPQNVYDGILAKTANKNYSLTGEELSYIQALKPVEVNRDFIKLGEDVNYNYINYVKSSLIPLIPNLTVGYEIDKLRELMETENIDQANLDSAGKAGNPIKTYTPYDIDNSFIEEKDKSKLSLATRYMKNDSFHIQQEIPFDVNKEKTTFVTQFNKLVLDSITLFENEVFEISESMRLSLPSLMGKGKLSGAEIAKAKEDIRIKIVEESFKEVRDEIGIDDSGNMNFNKLREFIIRNVSDLKPQQIAELDLLDGQFAIPMLFNRASNQIQSAIASNIKKAINAKMFGKSYVQVTSMGIKAMNKTGKVPSNIYKTKNWDGNELKPARPVIKEIYENNKLEIYLNQEQLDKSVKGESFKLTDEQIENNPELSAYTNVSLNARILPAQVIVPFQFFKNKLSIEGGKFNKEKEMLNIEDFLDENGNIDLDEDLLKMVGARIPNQSHSSQLPIEIVGFLPSTLGGDILYVPANITKQMGSDFDIDKLYVYKRKYKPYKEISELIDIIQSIRQQIKENKKILKDIKLTDDKFNEVTDAWKDFHDYINSEVYLEELKYNIIERVTEKTLDINDDLENSDIHDSIASITIADVVHIRNLRYKQIRNLASKKKHIYRIIKDIDKELKDYYRVFYVLNNLGDEVQNKSLFIDTVNKIDNLNIELKIFYEILDNRPYSLSSKLNIDDYGNELEIRDVNFIDKKVKKNKLKINKIISGLQTGIDTLGLEIAKRNNIPTGGTAPRKFFRETVEVEDSNGNKIKIVEDSKAIAEQYGVIEQDDYDEQEFNAFNFKGGKVKKDFFNVRTYSNVRDSDITLYFTSTPKSSGLNTTRNFVNLKAEKTGKEASFFVYGKDFTDIDSLERLLINRPHSIINIAGNRQSVLNEHDVDGTFKAEVENLLQALFDRSNQEEIEEEEISDNVINDNEEDEDIHYLELDDYKNAYFDTLYNILTSPAIFQRLMKPLDMDDLKVSVGFRSENKKVSYLFDRMNQLRDYGSNVGVKSLVGTFSLNLTLNSLLQRTSGVRIVDVMDNVSKASTVLNINGLNLTELSGIGFADVKYKYKGEEVSVRRTNSDNIIIPQSETVDHANNKIADKINLNGFTANAYALLIQTHDKNGKAINNITASQIINNEAIKLYVSKLKTTQDSFSEFGSRVVTRDIVNEVLKELNPDSFIIDEEKFKKGEKINTPMHIYDDIEEVSLNDEMLGIVKDEDGFIIAMNEPKPEYYPHILKAFLVADSVGKQLFNIMVSLNVDTKGIGTSVAGGNYKKSTIDDLKLNDGTQYISGYNNILVNNGEYTELGYIVNNSFNTLDTLNKVFYYDKLKDVFKKIGAIKNKELNDTELKLIIKNYVSYGLSKSYLWGNSSSERKRLLYTVRDARGKIVNLSLAERVAILAEKHPSILLFKKLETKIAEKKNQPDFIRYRTLDFEYDGDRLMNEFSTLLESQDDEIREVMQDLVKYSYVTGGNSSSYSFMKLIPSSLVINNFRDNMNEVVSGMIDNDRFIRQFYQHNPTFAKAVSFSNGNFGYSGDSNGTRKIGNNSAYYTTGGFSPAPKYIHDRKYNRKLKKMIYELYEKTSNGTDITNAYYQRIDTLGNFNISEYDFDSVGVISILPENMLGAGMFTETVKNTSPQEEGGKIVNVYNSVVSDIIDKSETFNQAVSELVKYTNLPHEKGNVLEEISVHKPMFQLILDTLNYNDKTINLYKINGRSNYSRNGIESKVSINDFLELGKSKEADIRIIQDLLHEGIHSITSDYIKDNPDSPSVTKLNYLRSYILEDVKSDKVIKEFSDNLDRLRNEYVNTQEYYNKLDVEFNTMSKKDDYRFRIAYYLTNNKEFIAGVFTDSDFQKLLNEYQNPLDRNESFIQAFVNTIRNILGYISEIIGLSVNEDSVLSEAITTSLEIITSKAENNNIDEVLFSPSKLFKEHFNDNDFKEINELLKHCI